LEIYESINQILKYNKTIIQPNIQANIYLTAAGNFRQLKQFEQSHELLNKALKLIKENYGEKNLPTATIYNNIGLNYKEQAKFDEALNYYKLALETREEFLEPTHPDVLAVKHNIGQLHYDKGDKEEAMKYFNSNLDQLAKKENLNNE